MAIFTRTTFLILALSTYTLVAQERESRKLKPPNILFIAIDDLRPALGCYGDPLAKTPYIDQFAKTARQFNHAYVQQAVCGPSRASLLTGLRPDRIRVWHNRNQFRNTIPDHITLPECFKNQGYVTLSLGKIFSGNAAELDPRSWSQPEVLRIKNWKNYLLPRNQGSSKKQSAYEDANVEDDGYPDGKLANLAIKKISDLKHDQQPFFLAVGFFKPHLPFNAPKKYWDLHDRNSFVLTEKLSQVVDDHPPLALHSHRELGGYKDVPKDESLSPEQTQLLRHGYYACVSYVDAQVGKILDALKRYDLEGNTIVVIWGDHGFALGEGSRWCKGTNFEIDTRVPLLIRTPELNQPGTATNSLVEMVDLYPTLTSLAGIPVTEKLDGRNLTPILHNPAEEGREMVLSQFNRPWTSDTPKIMGYSIRTETMRYTRWMNWVSKQTVAEELYQYETSKNQTPQAATFVEQQNLASQHPELLKSLSHQMDRFLSEAASERFER